MLSREPGPSASGGREGCLEKGEVIRLVGYRTRGKGEANEEAAEGDGRSMVEVPYRHCRWMWEE